MITLTQLAAELGRSKPAIILHYRKLGIDPKPLQINPHGGNSYVFTPAEANAIRQSVQTAKRGRPFGAKDSFKRSQRSDAGKPRAKRKNSSKGAKA